MNTIPQTKPFSIMGIFNPKSKHLREKYGKSNGFDPLFLLEENNRKCHGPCETKTNTGSPAGYLQTVDRSGSSKLMSSPATASSLIIFEDRLDPDAQYRFSFQRKANLGYLYRRAKYSKIQQK